MPKRNKIEMQGLVERICRIYFNDKMSHKQIAEILKNEGFDISKSGVGRTLVSQAAQMKAYKDSAKKAVAIVSELEKTPGLNISEGAFSWYRQSFWKNSTSLKILQPSLRKSF